MNDEAEILLNRLEVLKHYQFDFYRMLEVLKAAKNLIDHEFEYDTSNEWNDENNRRLIALSRAIYPDRDPPIKEV